MLFLTNPNSVTFIYNSVIVPQYRNAFKETVVSGV